MDERDGKDTELLWHRLKMSRSGYAGAIRAAFHHTFILRPRASILRFTERRGSTNSMDPPSVAVRSLKLKATSKTLMFGALAAADNGLPISSKPYRSIMPVILPI